MPVSVTFALTTDNVSSQVVTLPTGMELESLVSVELINSGDYTATVNDAPAQQSIVTGTLSTTGVKLTSATEITFGSGVTLDTAYGSVSLTGNVPGDVPHVS